LKLLQHPPISMIDRIGTSLQKVRQQFEDINGGAEAFKGVLVDLSTGALVGFANAAAQAFAAFMTGSKSAGQAFKQAMGSAIGSVAKQKGDYYAAEAAGDLGDAFHNPAAL